MYVVTVCSSSSSSSSRIQSRTKKSYCNQLLNSVVKVVIVEFNAQALLEDLPMVYSAKVLVSNTNHKQVDAKGY